MLKYLNSVQKKNRIAENFLCWKNNKLFSSCFLKTKQTLLRMKRKQNIKYYLECVRLRGDNNEVQIIMVSKYVGLSLSSNHKSSLHHRIITSIQEQLSRYWWFENSSFNIARKLLKLHAKSITDLKRSFIFLTWDHILISYSVCTDLMFS